MNQHLQDPYVVSMKRQNTANFVILKNSVNFHLERSYIIRVPRY